MMVPTLTRSRKQDPRDGWYLITPAQAGALLEHGGKNRPLKEFRAQKIAADILDGAWRPNGESFIFDDKGRPIDCQHRLRGCVLANKPIEGYCVFDIPSKYFPSFDQGAARGGNDLAALLDFANANLVAACTRLAMEYAAESIGKTGRRGMASERLRLYMERNRERLTTAVSTTVKFRTGIVKLIPLSHAAFVYYMNMEAHSRQALEFLEKLSSGAGLHKGDSLLLFRQRMTDLVGEKHKLRQDDKLALIIKTWNAFLAGKPIALLRWKRDVEAFPRFDQVAERA